jgi:hypothetical protein
MNVTARVGGMYHLDPLCAVDWKVQCHPDAR